MDAPADAQAAVSVLDQDARNFAEEVEPFGSRSTHLQKTRLEQLIAQFRRRQISSHRSSVHILQRQLITLIHQTLLLLLIVGLISPTKAAFIDFQNCLPQNALNSHPLTLQFQPNYTDAVFDTADPNHNVKVTIYGNVSGQSYDGQLPSFNDPNFTNPDYTNNKIADLYNNSDNGRPGETTLIPTFKVLTYTPQSPPPLAFCNQTRNGTHCPIAPVNDTIFEQWWLLPSFGFEYSMGSSFRFATLDTTFTINSGQPGVGNSLNVIGCISANITPDLGPSLRGMLRYLPMAILIVVAISTVSAAVFSPWGTSDPFKWTSNYGRDEDLLRLVTPGFGDCLQYIQFIFLSGAISLNYPGYFRPVVSNVNWSALMFNESFVSHGPGIQNPVDGIYVTRFGTQNGLDLNSPSNYGMSLLRQLTGMSADEDIWSGMVIWTLVIIGIVIVCCQSGFITRFVLRALADRPEEDLRSKNWPFTAGCLVRVVCNYFLLPIVALSMFQLVIAGRNHPIAGQSNPSTPVGIIVAAVILLVAILAFAGWILRIIFAAKPRSLLFDDLPTVLLYGPLYNTYSDDAAPFALIPALLTFVRAVAIGAVQPSGIAQIVILAICEVVLILTLQAFRPFRKQTSMNLYHTFFSVARLTVVLLSVSFTPSLGVTEPAKGWVGYIILFLHAVVLVFGFFLNSLQTLIEVIARYTGAGADEQTGAATRGAFVKVFGMRQLSRRARRPGFRHSMTSDAAILTDDQDAIDNKSAGFGGRSRSLSASSAILLNQRTPDRMSTHLDRTDTGSAEADHSTEYNAFSFLPDSDPAGSSRRPDLSLRTNEGQVFYRQPRPRRPTGDMMTPGARSRGSWASGEWINKVSAEGQGDQAYNRNSTSNQLSTSPEGNNKVAPAPAYMRQREGSDPVLNNDRNPRRSNVDYAVREVDFYYGMQRGPALNAQPTRKLKTGPADPVGPASSAAGWFRGFFGGNRKESGKGFEVVRSSRVPPQRFTDEEQPENFQEPYHDNPQSPPDHSTVIPGQRTRSNDADRHQTPGDRSDRGFDEDESAPSPINSDDEAYDGAESRPSRVSDLAPSLGPLDVGSSIHLPSRFNSNATKQPSRHPSGRDNGSIAPTVPYKSSRRGSQSEDQLFDPHHLSTVPDIPERHSYSHGRNVSQSQAGRVPFTTPLSPMSGRGSLGAESALDIDTMASNGREPPESSIGVALSAPLEDARHPSVGYVNQYRASDSITQGSADLNLREGTSAEFVSDSRKGSRPDRDVLR